MKAAPPSDILGSPVVDIRDVWTVEDRVYCEVRTASGWIATCLLIDRDEWHVCHAYQRREPSLWVVGGPKSSSATQVLTVSL